MNQPKQALSFVEFVAMMAMMMALTAMSIDAMLPALSQIGAELGVERANDSQLIISLLFLGMATGQMFYGPLSDSIGRKPAIYIGLTLFGFGCLLSMFATTFQMMLVGRTLQGLGIASSRVVSIALIRDLYKGRSMARVMSFIMATFILVPILAPSVGQLILLVAHWRAIFGVYLLLGLTIGIWFGWRQPETLSLDQRIPFSLVRIGRAIAEVVTNRSAFGYTVTAGLVFGAFIGYLNSAQQIFQEQYQLGQLFPLYFAFLALAFGSASIINARLVSRFGMRTLASRGLQGVIGLSIIMLGLSLINDGIPPLSIMTLYLMLTFFCIGILFGNLNALAMEPLGHIAGIGAAVVGSFSTFLSLFLGTIIGQSYNGTVLPLIGGFVILSLLALAVMYWVEAEKTVPVVSS